MYVRDLDKKTIKVNPSLLHQANLFLSQKINKNKEKMTAPSILEWGSAPLNRNSDPVFWKHPEKPQIYNDTFNNRYKNIYWLIFLEFMLKLVSVFSIYKAANIITIAEAYT